MRRLILLAALLLAALGGAPALAKPKAAPAPLILISIDGMRPDYLDRGVTPTLSALAAGGAMAPMRPSYPSLTFPNHYTLVTGLRPDHHGFVDNTMEDPAITTPDRPFSMSRRDMVEDARWWNGGEPIWVTAQRQGLKTGTLFWPGSEAAIRGLSPTYWKTFDHEMTSNARVDELLKWLDLPPDEWPRFLTLYFNVVDDAGHAVGPGSYEILPALTNVDTALARLLAGLQGRGLAANIVIVGDHGMAEVDPSRNVYLDDLAPPGSFRMVTWGSGAGIAPTPGREAEAEKALLGEHDHVTCWRKGEMPARFHYGTHPRIPPILCLAQTGWSLTIRDKPKGRSGGAHGYDPYALEMQTLFIANGPAFRKGVRLPLFDNVDVYPLLARVLGIRPQPNDGDLREVSAALR